MIRPRFVLRGAAGRLMVPALAIFLEALTAWNVVIMREAARRGTRLPPTYGGRLRYQRENYRGPHPEDWRDAFEVAAQGGGDCEDLAAYRAAELRVHHGAQDARPMYHARRLPSGGRLFHVIVESGAGLEDPSRLLGMSKE